MLLASSGIRHIENQSDAALPYGTTSWVHRMWELEVLRYTIRDSEKTVSFTGAPTLAPYLVAACASEPVLLEDLLLATERFSPGIVRQVMNQLLAADKAMEAGVDPSLYDAFEVVDETTARRAMKSGHDGNLNIDLVQHAISGSTRAGAPFRARGSVSMRLNGGLERETVYALSQDWTVDVEDLTATSEAVDVYA